MIASFWLYSFLLENFTSVGVTKGIHILYQRTYNSIHIHKLHVTNAETKTITKQTNPEAGNMRDRVPVNFQICYSK